MNRINSKPFHHRGRKEHVTSSTIQPEEETITIHGPLWKWNWVSKLRDGLLPALVLLLLIVVPGMVIMPIQNRFGRPGLLVYMLVLLTVGVVLLERSVHEDRPILRRAWYGLSGGMLTWMATDVTDRLSSTGLTSLNAVPFFLIIGLILAILWRRILPLPVRWFMLVFFLNWILRFTVSGEQFLINLLPGLKLLYPVTLGVGAAGAVACLWYIIWRSRDRLKRMRAALWLWFSVLLILQVMLVGTI